MGEPSTRDLTAADFKKAVLGNDNVLVYVWAPNCAPCDTFTPTYATSAADHPDIVYGKLNFETEKELVEALEITLLPTLMAFKKGKLVFKQPGIANPAVMDNLVQQLKVYRFAATPSVL